MSEEQTKQDRILMNRWGEHHWFMLFLIEDWCVWADGKVARPSIMRTNPQTHPKMLDIGSQLLADTQKNKAEEPMFPPEDFTKLMDGTAIGGHDSWDCIDDLIAYHLVDASLGEDGKPLFSLTPDGWAYAAKLRRHFAENKTLAGFSPIADSETARHHGWSVCLFGYDDGNAVAYEDGAGSRNTKVKIEDGSLWIGENTGDFSDDAQIVPMPIVLDLLGRVGCSPVQFTKVSLEHAKQECVDIKDRHLALCDDDSDEAVAAQTALECEEAIQAMIDKCDTEPPKFVVIPNDPWCDGCVHNKGSLFAPCRVCQRIQGEPMMGRTKYSCGF